MRWRVWRMVVVERERGWSDESDDLIWFEELMVCVREVVSFDLVL